MDNKYHEKLIVSSSPHMVDKDRYEQDYGNSAYRTSAGICSRYLSVRIPRSDADGRVRSILRTVRISV